jgi:EAL domain-containing protein (putative c-di-GMP-specific phosphodiesterase class I)
VARWIDWGRKCACPSTRGRGTPACSFVLALEPAFIKLDRSWVHGIDEDTAQALVAGLQHFAMCTESQLIAEGIETDAELCRLQDLGVELGQGFLLGPPQPVG